MARILVVAAQSSGPYDPAMELVGDILEQIEKVLGLDSQKIKENLEAYIAEQIRANTNSPADPKEVAQGVAASWRNWQRWRAAEVRKPQAESLKHMAAGLGYRDVGALKAAFEAFKQGKPLPYPAGKGSAGEVMEGVGLVSGAFDKPGLVRAFLLDRFSSRLAALPPDAREWISGRWGLVQERAAELDKIAAEIDGFLNMSVFKS
jgi:hypothetical protein